MYTSSQIPNPRDKNSADPVSNLKCSEKKKKNQTTSSSARLTDFSAP